MSDLIVEIKKIDRIKEHPNANKLEICEIGGWQCCCQKGSFKENDLVIYVPPDTLIPSAIADKWGVTAYLSKGERVKCVKLRGEPSFGFIVPNENNWPEGFSVVEHYGLKKYVPKAPRESGFSNKSSKRIPDHPLFVKYTDIENLRNYNNVLEEGEEVVIVEKVHGTSSRVAMIEEQFMGGSRNHARSVPYKVNKLPYTWKHFKQSLRECRWSELFSYPKEIFLDTEKMSQDWFLFPFTIYGVRQLLEYLGKSHKQVIIFGETYGPVQHMTYGCNELQWGAYDLMVDGKYIERDMFAKYCHAYHIPMLPILYRGPYYKQLVHNFANNKTAVGKNQEQISEGVVVRPIQERTSPKLGRVILKYISDDYLLKQEENRETFDVANDEADAITTEII